MQEKQQEGDRVRILRDSLGLNQEQFAKKIGFGRAGLSQIETGSRGLSPSLVLKIKSVFENVNIDWLMTGAGAMLIESSDDTCTAQNTSALEQEVHLLRERIAERDRTIQDLSRALRLALEVSGEQ